MITRLPNTVVGVAQVSSGADAAMLASQVARSF